MMGNTKSKYSFASPRRQQFPLPRDVIFYLMKNCDSPKVCQKLQQTCKHFFSKDKIIILDQWVYFNKNSWYYLKNKEKRMLNEQSEYWWLESNLVISRNSFLPKCVNRYSLKKLEISGKTLAFKEICFLLNGGKIEYLDLMEVNITYENGKAVTLDVILKMCPKITKLFYSNLCEIFSNETFRRLNTIMLHNKLENLDLIVSHIQGKIEAKSCYEFLEHFVDKFSFANIWFRCNIQNFNNFCANIKNNLKNYPAQLSINHDFP